MTCHAGAGSRKAGHVLVTAGSRAGVSAQVYHTARMQRVFATRFSGDGAYVFSGSDDMNVRVWKVRARRVSPAIRIPLEWGACVVCTLLWRSEPAGLVCQLAALRMLRSSSLFLVGVLPYQGMPVSLRMAACVYPGLQQKVSARRGACAGGAGAGERTAGHAAAARAAQGGVPGGARAALPAPAGGEAHRAPPPPARRALQGARRRVWAPKHRQGRSQDA